MRILVDARGLLEEVKAGVEGYTYNMLSNLQRMYPENEYILFSYSWSKSPAQVFIDEFNWKHYRWSNLLMSLKWRYLNEPKVDSYFHDIDVVWCPNIRFMPVGEGIKKIVTVHDLSFEMLPECYSSRRNLWHWYMNIRENLKKMDRIIAVSKKTADDIVNLYDIDPAKIRIVYSGVEIDSKLSVNILKNKYDIGSDYILYVSTLEPRKNIYNLVKAYAVWRKNKIRKCGDKLDLVDLVLVGGMSSECANLRSYVNRLRIGDHVHILGFVGDSEKMSIIARSKALFYNSYYEGFGFPPLEAMNLGVPSVVSYAGSLGEVVGRDCLVVDPLDIAGLVNSIDIVVYDEEIRKEFNRRGKDLAGRYTWENTVTNFHSELMSLV